MSLKTCASLLILAPLGTALAVGCTDSEPAAAPSMQTDATPTTQQGLTRAKLGAAPPVVQSKFLEEYPNAAVSNVDLQTAESGVIYYKIVYIEDGTARSVTYDQAGERLVRNTATRPADANAGTTTRPATTPPATRP